MSAMRLSTRRVLAGLMTLSLAACIVLLLANNASVAWADDEANNQGGLRQPSAENVTTGNAGETGQDSEDAHGSDDEEVGPESPVITLDPDDNSIKENQRPDSSFIYDTAIEDLAEADTYYDQQTVQVVGEAVGDIISEGVDGQGFWVVLWDDGSTVSVFMDADQASIIDTLGSYHRKGTMLQVRGEFHLVCDEHDGVSDIHATSVTVTSEGSQVSQNASAADFVPGICMLVAGFALLVLFRRMREKEM